MVGCIPAVGAIALSAFVSLSELPAIASASAFLAYQAPAAQRSDLLDELERVLGGGRRAAAEGRVAQFEDAMRPIFRSLPHIEGDRLPASGARYLLHRVFVDRHGWFVEGLASRGESWNSSSPASFFAAHSRDEVEDVFERRLGDRGLSLHETAVFAAMLESLVHEETLDRLHSAYRVVGLEKQEEGAKESEVEQVIDAYMLMLVLGLNHSTVAPELVSRAWGNIDQIYPAWGETQKWVREVRKEVTSADPLSRTAFGMTTQVLEEVADRYGRWQDSECMALKGDLMRYERGDTGRVLLRDFYSAALNGSFQYTESKEYLRELGVLDESTPSQPSVIISNYINGPSNCLASSKYYSVCCINECEALLQPLERHIGAPDALPSEIVDLVQRLPSATVQAPRTLPDMLRQRLEGIAAQHGGRVPIHGRLFAQWMHHAYPRECPYPHVSGTATLLSSREYQLAHGDQHVLSAPALQAQVYAHSEPLAEEDVISELPWSVEEELFVHVPARATGEKSSSFLRCVMMLIVASSMSVATVRAFSGGKGAMDWGSKKEKHMV